MGNFCKGLLVGTAVGMLAGAIVVVKNKKLSNKLKDGVDCAEDQIKKIKDSFEKKRTTCDCENSTLGDPCFCGEESCGCEPQQNVKQKK